MASEICCPRWRRALFGSMTASPFRHREPQPPVAHAPAGRRTGAVGLAAGNAVGLGEQFDRQPLHVPLLHRRKRGARDAEHAAVAGDPEAAQAIVEDAEQRVVGQPVAVVQVQEAVAAQLQQSAIAGDPQVAVGVVVEIERRHRRIALARQPGAHAAVGIQRGHAVAGADPQHAVAILAQRVDVAGRHALAGAVMAQHAAIAVDADAQVAAYPQFAVAALEQGAHVVGRQAAVIVDAHRHRHRPGVGRRQVEHALVVGAQPQAAVARQRHRQHRRIALAFAGQRHLLHPAVAPDVHAHRMADPDAAIVLLHQRAHIAVAQPGAAIDAEHRAVGNAEQAVGRAHPQQAVAILEQRRRQPPLQSMPLAEDFDPPMRVPHQAVQGGNPQVAVAILEHRLGALRGDARDLPVLHPPHAAAATDQQSALPRLRQPQHGGFRQADCAAPVADLATGDAEQAVAVADQHLVAGQRQHRQHALAAQQRMRADFIEPALPIQAEQRAVGAYPQFAVQPVFQAGHAGQRARLAWQARPLPLPETDQARLETPQVQHHVAIAGGGDRAHALDAHAGHGGRLVAGEMQAVEAGRAFPRPHPDVAVAILRDVVDEVVRQPVLHRPVRQRVFVDGAGGIQRPRGNRPQQEGQQAAAAGQQTSHAHKPWGITTLSPPGTAT